MKKRAFVIFLFLTFLACSRDWNNPVTHNGGQQDHMPTEGLVAYHPFNGNADDSSGNGFNGAIYGATLAADRFGRQNCAYKFDGLDDYIDIGNPAGVNPPEITQCAWIKSNQAPVDDNVILTKRHDATGSDWPTLAINQSGYAECILDDAFYRTNAISNTKVIDNKWHFLCGIRNQTIYQIYVDGVLEKELIDGHAMGGSAANLHVGHHGGWNRYFNGLIDDVRIYTRALSKLEIDTLYHENGYTPPLDTPSLTAYGLTETSIKIQWNRVPEASSYSLEHSASWTGSFSPLYAGADTTCIHSGLTKGQIAWYRLKTSNTAASSAWSDTISASSHALPFTGLIAYFPFNGNANDMSGNGNNGTVNSATLAVDRHGNVKNAYAFNGSSYIVVKHAPVISLQSTQPFTISIWVYKLASGLPLHIMGKRVGCSTGNINYQIAIDTNGFRFDSSSFLLIWAAGIAAHKWVHVCVTYDTNGGKLYLDGKLKHSNSAKIGATNNVDLLIGKSGSCGALWVGSLDDIRIYNRLLSDDEIQQLYHENGWSN